MCSKEGYMYLQRRDNKTDGYQKLSLGAGDSYFNVQQRYFNNHVKPLIFKALFYVLKTE